METDIPERSLAAMPGSALMVAAVRAFHREEKKWTDPVEVFRKPGNQCLRIFVWASKRWGMRWQRLEFDMRNKPNDKLRHGGDNH